VADGGVLQLLVCEERHKVVPEYAADHGRHDGATELPLDVLQLIDKHTIILFNLRVRTRLDFAHFRDALSQCASAQVEREHVVHARIKILAETSSRIALIKSLCHHNRICNKNRAACALLWLPMRCHRVLSDNRRCCPNGVQLQ